MFDKELTGLVERLEVPVMRMLKELIRISPTSEDLDSTAELVWMSNRHHIMNVIEHYLVEKKNSKQAD